MLDPSALPPDGESPSVTDIIELVWLPALLALITASSTWLIWYYTHTVCTPEVAALTGCNVGPVAKYVDVDVFGRMLTYGGLVAGIGGFWRYDMIKKERAARIAAQNQLAEIQKQWQEERQNLMASLAEQRLQAAEERERAIQQASEDREQAARQAAEDRQAFLAALSDLTAELAHLRQQRNGDIHNGQ